MAKPMSHFGRAHFTKPSLVLLGNTCSRRLASTISQTPSLVNNQVPNVQNTSKEEVKNTLERLPTPILLRNYLLSSLFASKWAFRSSFAVLRVIANSNSRLLNPDSNPLIRALLKGSVYDHFCAGKNAAEVQKCNTTLTELGFTGMILCYAKEIQVSQDGKILGHQEEGVGGSDATIELWKQGILKTLDMLGPNDWTAIKLTGAGPEVMAALMSGKDLPPTFLQAMDEICERGTQQGCRIAIDAEQQAAQGSIEKLAIDLMRKWNANGKTTIYTTIQAYLKASRPKLQHHLQLAQKENWNLGIKLVRGAYIMNDKRELIHDTKEDTDASYDGIVHDLLRAEVPGIAAYPKFELLVASHNSISVQKANELATQLCREGRLNVKPEFAQLQGMADDLGCETLQTADEIRAAKRTDGKEDGYIPKCYKFLTWGTLQQCMQYLLRRAIENQAATERMKDGATVFGAELRRRIIMSFGLR